MDAWNPARLIGVCALLAVSLVTAAGPAAPIAWQGSTEIATGRAERGPWQQSESRFDYVDDPSVAMDEEGNVALAWVDQKRKAVLFQRFGTDGKADWAAPVDVSRRPDTFSWLPRVALAPDAPRKVFILWQEIIFSGGSHGGDILFARSDDAGRSFSEPLNLSRSVGGDGKGRINKQVWHNGSLDLAAGPNGVLYAAWTEYDGPLWFSRSTDGGGRFSRPLRITAVGPSGVARAPALALGAGGTVYLAWTTGDDETADIHLAASKDGGVTFGPPQRVAPSRQYSDAPSMAVDAQGVLHLAYAESAGGPFAAYHIRYTRSTDGGRSFEASRDIATPMPPGAASAAFPSLSVDGEGRVYVLWELFTSAGAPPRGLAIAVSPDRGRNFTAPVLVPGSIDSGGGVNGSSQGLLMRKLAVNARGAVAVANSSFKQDAYSRVWLLRGNAVSR